MNVAREEMEADPHVQHVRRLLGYADLEAVDFDTLVAIGMLASSMRERDTEIERLRAERDVAHARGALDMRTRAAEVARGCATKTLDDGGHDIADAMAHGIADSIEALGTAAES